MPSTSAPLNPAQLISQGRSITLGFATLCILLFHQQFFVDSALILPFHLYGYWGVELFLFLSGFGIYYSLKKSGNTGTMSFYKRRLVRIMPAAILVGICLTLCNPLFGNTLINGKLPYGLTPIPCILGIYLWYIRAILLFYLLSPLLFRLLRRPVLLTGVVLISCAIGLTADQYLTLLHHHNIYTSLVWPALRFPCYILGMKVADIFATEEHRSWDSVRLCAVLLPLTLACLAAAGYSSHHAYHFFLLLPASATISILFGCIKVASFSHPISVRIHHDFCRVFSWIGERSLEFYVLHLGVYNAIKYLHPEVEPWLLLTALLIVTLLAIPLHMAAAHISAFLNPRKD